jgi:hypothetical protein
LRFRAFQGIPLSKLDYSGFHDHPGNKNIQSRMTLAARSRCYAGNVEAIHLVSRSSIGGGQVRGISAFARTRGGELRPGLKWEHHMTW